MTELTAIAVTLSPIVADLVASLLVARAPVIVAKRFKTRQTAEAWMSRNTAELIIVGVAGAGAGEVIDRFLALAPGATVLALSDDGRSALLRANGIGERQLNDVSPDQLVDAVLASIARARRPGTTI